MSKSNSLLTKPQGATNFDLPSLHILQSEVDIALKNAETHLSEFNDDEEQAPLLLDSVDVLTQLAEIFDLLALDGGSDLSRAISEALQLLYDNGNNNDDELILNISEAIMTLNRYVEFVLLKETLEPTLLLPIINKLYNHLGKAALTENTFADRGSNSISISDPEKNYKSLASLKLDSTILSAAYRSGLGVALSATDANISDTERKQLEAMQQACDLVAKRSDSLFWQAAAAVVTDIEKILPLKNPQKRTLVFLEQQFKNYISVNDKRFADLVSFACQRDNSMALSIKQKYSENKLDEAEYAKMKRFLFGPNKEVTDTLNDLIQEQISNIKDNADSIARGETIGNSGPATPQDIVNKLKNLSDCTKLLGLDTASQTLLNEANAVSQWTSPTPEDFDQLLTALIVAENASIHMSKLHTPGSVSLPLHNNEISLHQLDTSFETLVIEARTNIAKIEEHVTNYIQEDMSNPSHLETIPTHMEQLVGPLSFLQLNDASLMIGRLSKYVQEKMISSENGNNEDVLAKVADVLMAVDYHLEGLENNHPVGKEAINIGHESLNSLLAA